MKHLYMLLGIFTIIFNSSCSVIAVKKYGLDRKFDFSSKAGYLDFIRKEKTFPVENLLYLDSSSYFPYMTEVVGKGSETAIVYQGTWLNDSVQIKHNDFLRENESCYGRIEDQIQSNISFNKIPDSLLIKGKYLSRYKLRYLNNNELFDIRHTNKPYKVFLGSIHQAGTYYRDFYKKMIAFRKKNAFVMDLYFILLDPVYQLK